MKSYIIRFEIFNEKIAYLDFDPPTPKCIAVKLRA